jgi:hypothetical protein
MFIVLFAICVFPAQAAAQASFPTRNPLIRDIPLSRVVFELYLAELQANEDAGGVVSDTDLTDAQVLSAALGIQISNFPLGSSAGGFTWTFDPSVGAFTRATSSFGPVFAERAMTVGRNKLNFGLNYQLATFDEIEGVKVRNGDVKFYTQFPAIDSVGEDSLLLDVSSNTVGFFLNYGVTDRLDVGFVLPFITVNMDATVRFNFVDSQGQQSGTFVETRSGGRSKSGFGDIVARAKYNVWKQPGGGAAVGFDWRLPTGDEDNLLGIPGTQYKLYGIYSTTFGRFNPHANVGYTFSNGNKATPQDSGNPVLFPPPDEFNYAFGLDVAVQPKLTIAGDIVGRQYRDILRLEEITVFGNPAFTEFDLSDTDTLNMTLASIGAKYNIWGNLLVTGNVLFPFTKGGLRDKFTPVIGLDYSF